jgi:phosphate transport system permease protein
MPVTRARSRGRVRGWVFLAFLLLSLAVGFATLFVLLIDVVQRGFGHLSVRLLTEAPSATPELAGARPAILATIYIGLLLLAFVVPIGVGTAIYLEEYANRERWYNRLLEVNIQNLAAVPSIVYGILGLAFLVRGFADLGQTVLAGALTLALLVLPIVIISSREAIRAVPDSIRQGSLALGATKWQTIRRQVLPGAIPGIATGSILALSRAIGEAAPLVLLGALTFITFNPEGLDSAFTALPIQIFNWISRPQDEFKVLAAAAIVVLLVILLVMNTAAILLRNRYQKKW